MNLTGCSRGCQLFLVLFLFTLLLRVFPTPSDTPPSLTVVALDLEVLRRSVLVFLLSLLLFRGSGDIGNLPERTPLQSIQTQPRLLLLDHNDLFNILVFTIMIHIDLEGSLGRGSRSSRCTQSSYDI